MLAEQVERELRQGLPSYMVPTAFVMVDRFALNQNGKIDLSDLPAHTEANEEFALPATPDEVFIHDLWRRVLGHDSFGRLTNFFEAGEYEAANPLGCIRAQALVNRRLLVQ